MFVLNTGTCLSNVGLLYHVLFDTLPICSHANSESYLTDLVTTSTHVHVHCFIYLYKIMDMFIFSDSRFRFKCIEGHIRKSNVLNIKHAQNSSI